jgi:hypothetical protein
MSHGIKKVLDNVTNFHMGLRQQWIMSQNVIWERKNKLVPDNVAKCHIRAPFVNGTHGPIRNQFHQCFLRAFFYKSLFGSFFLVTFWQINTFVQKMHAKNIDEIDTKGSKILEWRLLPEYNF